MNIGSTGIWFFTEGMSSKEAAAAARRIEALGFSAFWIPETVGRDSIVHSGWLLSQTEKLIVATGIANIYNRHPGIVAQAQKTLAEQSNNRFLLGLGVSHTHLVKGVRKLDYGKPVSTMRDYLKAMAESRYSAPEPSTKPPLVIAALGPKMLELAAELCDGAHPYFTSPEHTRMARSILGPDKWLCVEQKVILESDPKKARELARATAAIYIQLPNYRNNWLRMGLTEDDLKDKGSDDFIDQTFAWGDIGAIRERIQAHFDAGADHVCVQPVHPSARMGQLHWEVLEQIAEGNLKK